MSCQRSVGVLLQPPLQRHRYLEVVYAVDGDAAPDGEATVFLERAHTHEPRDRVEHLVVSAADEHAVFDEFVDGPGAAVSVMREHEPAVAVRDARVYLENRRTRSASHWYVTLRCL